MPGENHIQFAERILIADGSLIETPRARFVDGKTVTPLRLIQAANRLLKKHGEEQITGDPEWLQ